MGKNQTPKKLHAIELFAGIGGFRLAAEEHGIETIWANDIDPHASKVYRERFGEQQFTEGDIWKLIDETPPHQLLTGGFPCQPFSSAGKKKGIEDPRGTLFEAIIKIIKKHQPEYFILENVKRLLAMDNGRHFATILASLAALDYRIEWRLLNAMNFSLPQNRQRVVITGIHKRTLPELHTYRLATGEEISMLDQEEVELMTTKEKWRKIVDHGFAFANWGIADGDQFFGADLTVFSHKSEPVTLKKILQKNVHDGYDLTEITNQWISKNTPVNKFVGGVEIISNQAGGARMGYTIFGTNGVAPTLTSSTSRHYERYKINGGYRRLTPIEYARIQGFPDDHCESVPDRLQYVLYGNAVPPPLVKWVMQRLFSSSPTSINDIKLSNQQLSLEGLKSYAR